MHAGGHRFDPVHLHQFFGNVEGIRTAEWENIPHCLREGHRFDPVHLHHRLRKAEVER